MPFTRRQFLRSSAASAALLTTGALESLAARLAAEASLHADGFGPLHRDPNGLLDLPAGFQYRTLSGGPLELADPRFSQRLSDGTAVPGRHDGMAAFAGPGGVTVLVRNHELDPGHTPVAVAGARHYDPLGTGGTTTLWIDSERRLVRSFASLAGTFRNCAGGATPWGTWLSAEECTYMPGPLDPLSHDRRPEVSRRHGYLFEVDARAEKLGEGVPILAMGRFYHEAVAVDPVTGFVYLTEDRNDGLLYRYRPRVVVTGKKHPRALGAGDLAQGGTLEALRIVGRPAARTQGWDGFPSLGVGRRYSVDWVAIPDIDPEVDMERDPTDPEPDPFHRRERAAPGSVRAQGFRLGAAQFARHEGITYHAGSVYVCATNGGTAKAGQVWRLDLRKHQLSLLVEPNDRSLMDGPDNLTLAPNGDLVVCEDGPEDNTVFGITPRGRIYRLARNAFNQSEFAGACFAPDGRTLFVNMQEPGVTYAIWGPWEHRIA